MGVGCVGFLKCVHMVFKSLDGDLDLWIDISECLVEFGLFLHDAEVVADLGLDVSDGALKGFDGWLGVPVAELV